MPALRWSCSVGCMSMAGLVRVLRERGLGVQREQCRGATPIPRPGRCILLSVPSSRASEPACSSLVQAQLAGVLGWPRS